jgi:hypothetical protein
MKTAKALTVLVLTAMIFGLPAASHAASAVITLTRTTALTNITDAVGITQHDGGTISIGSTVIGRFIRTSRVVTGVTDAQNTAITTINLFGLGTAPTPSLVLIGTHSFDSGNEIGGVGASSIPGLTGSTWSAVPSGSGVYTLTLNLP